MLKCSTSATAQGGDSRRLILHKPCTLAGTRIPWACRYSRTFQRTVGNHAFCRFRNLGKKRLTGDRIQCWLGHAGNSMTDEYSRVRDDLRYRKLVAEQVGIGFELPIQAAPIVPNVPKSGFAVEVEVAVSCKEAVR